MTFGETAKFGAFRLTSPTNPAKTFQTLPLPFLGSPLYQRLWSVSSLIENQPARSFHSSILISTRLRSLTALKAQDYWARSNRSLSASSPVWPTGEPHSESLQIIRAFEKSAGELAKTCWSSRRRSVKSRNERRRVNGDESDDESGVENKQN